MGQQLFKVDSETVDWSDVSFKLTDISSESEQEDINFFLPAETDETVTRSNEFDIDRSSSNSETIFIEKLRNRLFRLTHPYKLEQIHVNINHILMDEVFPSVNECYKSAVELIRNSLENQHQLQTSLTNKFHQDDNENQSIFSQSSVDESVEDETDQQANTADEQVFSIAIQSLTSILLLLIKSAEKHDPSLVQQIITLTSQLCERLPMGRSSSSRRNILLFGSLKPVVDFVTELSLSTNQIIATAAIKILLSFSIAQASFKEILPLLARLIFDTDTIYDVRRLFVQLNNGLMQTINQQEKQKQQINIEKINDASADVDEDATTTSEEIIGKVSNIKPLCVLLKSS